jgi:hypothetical protein
MPRILWRSAKRHVEASAVIGYIDLEPEVAGRTGTGRRNPRLKDTLIVVISVIADAVHCRHVHFNAVMVSAHQASG